MPNHRITSGIIARCGMLRSICSEESSSRSATGNDAVEQAEGEAEAAADGEPDQRALGADPDMVQQRAAEQRVPERPAPWRWAPAGRAPTAAQRARPAPRRRSSADRQQPGRQRARAARGSPALTRPPAACRAGGDLVGDRSRRTGRHCGTVSAGAAGRGLQRQEREHQLGEAVALLEMRVAGQDEGVDARAPCTPSSAPRPSRGRRPAPCRRRRAPGRRRPTDWG